VEPDRLTLFYRFGVAPVLGLFMGLQREYAYRDRIDEEGELLAGARTFPIIALLGAASALMATELGTAWPFAMAVIAVALLLSVGHFWQACEREMGLTTEMAALVAFFTGGLCYWGHIRLGAALSVGTAVVLSLKVQTHTLARMLDREDVFATLKFAVITVIVLPLLPQQGYGPSPFDVLVPYNVWLMVVLISGISFLGYVLIKVVGPRRGVGLTGILGGLASSTAVTLSVAERSRDSQGLDRPFALAVTLAWAITFGVLYAVILVVSNWAQAYFGDAEVYLSSVVAGLADVDAITLSMARLHESGDLGAATATHAIVIAAAANTVLKEGIVALTGTRGLRRAVLLGLLLIVGASGVALLLI